MSEIDSLATIDYILKLRRRSPEEIQDYLLSKYALLEVRTNVLEKQVESLLEAHNYRKPQSAGKPGQINPTGEGWVDPPEPPEPQIAGPTSEEIDLNEALTAARWQIKRLEKENEQKRQCIAALEWEYTSLNETIDILTVDDKRLEAKNKRLEDTIARLNSHISDIEAENKRLEDLSGENEWLKDRVAELEKQVPKERMRVKVGHMGKPSLYYVTLISTMTMLHNSYFADHATAMHWATDRGLEVVE